VIRVVGGTHKGRRLATVPGRGTRPSSSLVRKALFDIAREHVGGRVLDLFSGTGAIALEALSRGAPAAVAIEAARPAAATIARNAEALGEASRLTVVQGDVLAELARPAPGWAGDGPFSLIYADPPYMFEEWEPLIALATRYLEPGGMLAVEHGGGSALAGRGRDYKYGGSVISVIPHGSTG